jgi:hypothetical protein
MIARADRLLLRTLVRADSMPLSCMAMAPPAFNTDEANRYESRDILEILKASRGGEL